MKHLITYLQVSDWAYFLQDSSNNYFKIIEQIRLFVWNFEGDLRQVSVPRGRARSKGERAPWLRPNTSGFTRAAVGSEGPSLQGSGVREWEAVFSAQTNLLVFVSLSVCLSLNSAPGQVTLSLFLSPTIGVASAFRAWDVGKFPQTKNEREGGFRSCSGKIFIFYLTRLFILSQYYI